MEVESGEQVEDELESVTSSAEWFMQGWRDKVGWCSTTLSAQEDYIVPWAYEIYCTGPGTDT